MAVTITELAQSRSIDNTGGKRTGKRVFHVYDASTPITTSPAVLLLFGSGILPNKFFPFPDLPSLLAINYRVMLEDGQYDLWRVEWDYEEVIPGTGGPNLPVPPGEVGYIEFNADIRAESQEFWRTDPGMNIGGVPTGINGNISNNNTDDIGGTNNNIAGVPGTASRSMVEFQISEVIEGSLLGPFAVYFDQVNSRNSVDFLIFGAGRVVYLGAKTSRTAPSRFNVTHSFVYDEFYHLYQVPSRDENGVIILDNTEDANSVARYVYWRQAIPKLRDHNQLSNNF